MALQARIAAYAVDVPRLRAAGVLKAKLVERDRHLHFVAGVGDAARRVPDRAPGHVVVARHVVVDGIHLHAVGIDEQLVGAPFVVEGVQHHPDEIVVPRVVPVGVPRPNLRRVRVVALERDEEPRVVVRQEHLGTDRRLDVLPRPHLVTQLEGERNDAPGTERVRTETVRQWKPGRSLAGAVRVRRCRDGRGSKFLSTDDR